MQRESIGRVIFLNGASSSGKTSIAKELQDMLEEPWLHMGIDHFLVMMPQRYFGLDPAPGTPAAAGFAWITGQDGEETWFDITPGPFLMGITRGMRRAMAAFAMAGYNLIIDDVLLTPDLLDDYLAVLSGIDVLFVGVRLPVEVLRRREQERGDRPVGQARGHHTQVHAHGLYDVEVDTSILSARECATRIIEHLRSGPPPDAFTHLRLLRLQSG